MEQNKEKVIAQKISEKYMEKKERPVDALKKLDAKVKRPANTFAYVFGTISALIMGCGMSLVMTEIGVILGISNPLVIGIVIGVIGMLLALVNYPIYKTILNSRRKKYAAEILSMSEAIIEK